MPARARVTDFALANPLYAGAIVSAFLADPDGSPSSTLADLFGDVTTSTPLANPQTLDGVGKFNQPVYIDQDIVLAIATPDGIGDTITGVISPPADISNQSVVASGGSIARTLADRFAVVADVRDGYGGIPGARCNAVYDGAYVASGTDDTAAIQAAVNAVAAAGGGAVFIPGRCLISAGIAIAAQMVTLVGYGGIDGKDDTGLAGSASAINLARAASRSALVAKPGVAPFKMLRWCSGPDDGTSPRLRGGGMRGLFLDGQGIATRGIENISWRKLHFEDVHAVQTTDVGWMFATFSVDDGTPALNKSNGWHQVVDCSYYGAGNGLVLTGANRKWNTCLSRFDGFRSSQPMLLEDSDSCVFTDCNGPVTLRASGTHTYQIGLGYSARHHVFIGGEMTITSKAATDGSGWDALGNVVLKTMDNSSPKPTIESPSELLTILSSADFSSKAGSLRYGGGLAGCYNSLAAPQTFTTGVTAFMSWANSATQVTDPLGCYAGGNPTRITVPPGVRRARFHARIAWNVSAAGLRYADIIANGNTGAPIAKDARAGITTFSVINDVTTHWLSVTPGTYLEVRCQQSSGGNLDVLTGGTFFEAEFQ